MYVSRRREKKEEVNVVILRDEIIEKRREENRVREGNISMKNKREIIIRIGEKF